MSAQPRPSRPLAALAAPLCAMLLVACSKPAPTVEAPRPVRALVLAEQTAGNSAEFSGEVRARIESRLGFRVGGKITARKVEIGDHVQAGQVLMQLDPGDLSLAATQAAASLRAAQTQRDLAKADYARYQELRSKNFVSESVLDAKRATLRAAQAEADAATAGASSQANQARYTTLLADTAGVVAGLDAEVGQVVAAGTPVLRLARTDQMDVVIGIPENRVASVREGSAVTVRTWASRDVSIAGQVRVVAPVADAATRTYVVKVAIPASPAVRLGMSATVALPNATGASGLRAPLTALHHEKGVTSVWLIEQGKVKLVPVQLGGQVDNEVLIVGGVKAGQQIVTAGVNLLKKGQQVSILRADVARRSDTEATLAGAVQ